MAHVRRGAPLSCRGLILYGALQAIACSAGGDKPGDTGSGGATGGASAASGGATSTGAASGTSGGTGQGGSVATGGAGPGGSGGATGGSPASGGLTGGGGTSGAGGTAYTGGASSGGASSGGASSGGASSGGASSGGASSGGASSGGASSGGASSGGASSGGASSGGAPGKKFVGNITTGGQVRSDFITYWDQITPENEGKWGSVEGTKDRMNWAGLDRVHDYAKQHGIPFKQHTMVWGAQQPSWVAGLSQAEQRAQVEEWIRLFCERYPDTQLIDVVNEPPPHTTPPYAAALGGAGASGWDWIVQSFKWTHQYCPNAILIMNDYNTIEYANDNSHFIDIVKKIKAAGAPIDAVGVQAHAAYSMQTSTVKMYLDRMASETKLPIYVSEYDINVASDAQQKTVMESQFTMFWNHESVKGITLWGYVSGQTWQANTGLMSSGGTKRPAMTWLLDYLNR